MAKPLQKIMRYVVQHGIVRPRDIEAIGIPPEYLFRLHRQGRLSRPGRGIYTLPDANITWTFDMASLRASILTSFERRGSPLPEDIPFALTEAFLNDPQKKLQWNTFVNRLNPGDKLPSLEEVGALLRNFLLPCVAGESSTKANARRWTPTLN